MVKEKSRLREYLDVHGEIKAQRKDRRTGIPDDQYYYDPFLWGYIAGTSFDNDGFHHDGGSGPDAHHGHHGGSHHHGGGDFHHDGGIGGDIGGDIIGGIFAAIIIGAIVGPVIDYTLGAMGEGIKNWSSAIKYVNARRKALRQK